MILMMVVVEMEMKVLKEGKKITTDEDVIADASILGER